MGGFDSSVYYRLTSDNYGNERALSCRNDYLPHNVTMSLTARYDSDNWQLFGQDGVYFIRNYIYNTTYHLGLDIQTKDWTTPVMLPATTELGQQWLIVPWDEKNSTYKIENRLLIAQGIDSFMGIGVNAIFNIDMQTTSFGALWTFTQDADKGAVSADMLSPYSAIQSLTDYNQSNTATLTARPSGSATISPSPPDAGPLFSPGSGLTPVSIGGIVAGVISCVVALLVFLLVWRRYRKYGHTGPREVPGPPVTIRQQRHAPAEVVQEPLPVYSATNQHTSWGSEALTLPTGLSGCYSAQTRQKESDEQSIELPPYGRSSTEERHFV